MILCFIFDFECHTHYDLKSKVQINEKMEPVRMLEAHMASLRQSYEDWMNDEPEDLESDCPTDAEMAAFEAQEVKYIEQVS